MNTAAPAARKTPDFYRANDARSIPGRFQVWMSDAGTVMQGLTEAEADQVVGAVNAAAPGKEGAALAKARQDLSEAEDNRLAADNRPCGWCGATEGFSTHGGHTYPACLACHGT